MHEHVLAALLRLDESVAFCRVEPLHCTCRHVDLHIGPTAHQDTRFAKRAEARMEPGPLVKHVSHAPMITAPYFRYPYHHKPTDMADKIDAEKLARSVKGVERVIRDAAKIGKQLPWRRKRNSGTSRT